MPKIIPPKDLNRSKKLESFDKLLTVMDELRLNCPWDRKQTLDSLRHLSIEEVYELSEAIIQENTQEVKKELGDIMLHLVFYAKIAEENGDFDISDVLNHQVEKMIFRHPHIYSDAEVQDEEDVKRNWEALKQKEGKGNNSVLGGVPKGLPAMVKATRIQSKARGVGFDWENGDQVWEKVLEELNEFKTAKNQNEREEELGDLLFSIINYARFEGLDPEAALEKTNHKFINRFNWMESKIKEEGKQIQDYKLDQLDEFWNQAKKELKN